MASKFTITAELNLQTKNLNQVVGNLRKQFAGANLNIKIKDLAQAQAQIQKIGTTAKQSSKSFGDFANGVVAGAKRFTALTAATATFVGLARAIKSGVSDAIEFEREVVKIAQATGKTVSQLQGLTKEITSVATQFGVSSKELINAARNLTQAGFAADKVTGALKILAQTELAATFDSISDTTEGTIALLNQFGREAQRTGTEIEFLEKSLSAINQVSKDFAVESSDLITAIRTTGSAFESAGGSLNELLALFTSVRSTTRESAESISTGFRTIFTRTQRVDTINNLKKLGIELQDAEGKFVGPVEATKRLSAALNAIDPRDYRFNLIVEQLGGFRQVSKVIPLIQQFSVSQRALNTAQGASGSLAKDAATAQQSLAVQIEKVREEFKALIREMTGTDTFKTIVQDGLALASAMIKVASAIKPIIPLLAGVAAIKLGQAFVPAIKSVAGLGRKNAGGPIHHFATGGLVPGVGNIDSVPANLTPGEFVIKKSSVQKLGVDNLQRINSGGYAKYNDGTGPQGASGRDINQVRKNIKSVKYANPEDLEKQNLQIPGKFTPFDIGAVFLRPSGISSTTTGFVPIDKDHEIGKINETPYGPQIAKAYNPSHDKSRGVYYKLHSRSLSDPASANIEHIITKKVVEAVDESSNAIDGMLGTRATSQSLGEILKKVNIDQISGNIFEATLLNMGAPFDSSQSSSVSFDFKKGLGGISKFFSNAEDLTNNPTDARNSYTIDSVAKIAPKINRLVGEELDAVKKRERITSSSANLESLIGKRLTLSDLASVTGKSKPTADEISQSLSSLGYDLQSSSTKGKYEISKIIGKAQGGLTEIPWMSEGGSTDTVPAMLTPGEFVINKASAQKIGYSALNKMNKVGKFAKGGAVQHFAGGGMTLDDEEHINRFLEKLDKAGVGLQKLAEVKDILYAVANESEHLVGAMKSIEKIIQQSPNQKTDKFSPLNIQRIENAAIQGGAKNPSQGKQARIDAALQKAQEKRIKQENQHNKQLEDAAKKQGESTGKLNENLVLFGSLAASTAIQFSGLSDAMKEGLSTTTATFGAVFSLGKSLMDIGEGLITARNAARLAAAANIEEAGASKAATVADLQEATASKVGAVSGGTKAASGFSGLISGINPLTLALTATAGAFAIMQGIQAYYSKKAQEAAEKTQKFASAIKDATSQTVTITKGGFLQSAQETATRKIQTETSVISSGGAAMNLEKYARGGGVGQVSKNSEILSQMKKDVMTDSAKLNDSFYSASLSLNDMKKKIESNDIDDGLSQINATSEKLANEINKVEKDIYSSFINKEALERNKSVLVEYRKAQEENIGKLKQSYAKAPSEKTEDKAIITAMSLARNIGTERYANVKNEGLKEQFIQKDMIIAAKQTALEFNQIAQQVKQTEIAIAKENLLREKLLGNLNEQIALASAITDASNNLEDFTINLSDASARLGGEGEFKSQVPNKRAIEQLRPGKELENALGFIQNKNLGGGINKLIETTRAGANVKTFIQPLVESIANIPALGAQGAGKVPPLEKFVKEQLSAKGVKDEGVISSIVEKVTLAATQKKGNEAGLGPEARANLTKDLEDIFKQSADQLGQILDVFSQYEAAYRKTFDQILELQGKEAEYRAKAASIEGEYYESQAALAPTPELKREYEGGVMRQENLANAQRFQLEGGDFNNFMMGGAQAVNGLVEGINKAKADLAKGIGGKEAALANNRILRLSGALEVLTESSKTLSILQQRQADSLQELQTVKSAQEEAVFGGQENRMQMAQTENFLRMFFNNPMFRGQIQASGGLNDVALKNIQEYANKFRNVELGPQLGGRTGQNIIDEIINFQGGGGFNQFRNQKEKQALAAQADVKQKFEERKAASLAFSGLTGEKRQEFAKRLGEAKTPEDVLRLENTKALEVANENTKQLNAALEKAGVTVIPKKDDETKKLTDEIIKLKDEEVILKGSIETLNGTIKQLNQGGRNANGVGREAGPPLNQANGGLIYAANGKYVNFKPQGTDTVPAMLSPGEFVVKKSAVDKVGVDRLHAINSGNHLAFGGMPFGFGAAGLNNANNWMTNSFNNMSNSMMGNWYNYATAPDRAFGQFSDYMYNSFNQTANDMIGSFNQTALSGFAGDAGFSPMNMEFTNNTPMNIGLPFSDGGIAYLAKGGKGRRLAIERTKGKRRELQKRQDINNRPGRRKVAMPIIIGGPNPARDDRSDYQKEQDRQSQDKAARDIRIREESEIWAAKKAAEAKEVKSPQNILMDEVQEKIKAQTSIKKAEQNKAISQEIPINDQIAIKINQKEREAAETLRKKQREDRNKPIITPKPYTENIPKTTEAEPMNYYWPEPMNYYWHGIRMTKADYEKVKAEEDARNASELIEKDMSARNAESNVHDSMVARGMKSFAGLFGYATGGVVPSTGFAKGGIKNIGSTDKIPAMLTPGEFVMNAQAVKKFGTNTMHQLNNGNVQGFATGGMVGGGGGGGAMGGGVDVGAISSALSSAFTSGSQLIKNAIDSSSIGEVGKTITDFTRTLESFISGITNITMTHTVNLSGSITIAGLNVQEISDVINKNVGNMVSEKIQEYMQNQKFKKWESG